MVSIAMLVSIAYDHETQLEQHLHSRAELVANSLNYAAESMSRVSEVQRMIATMSADEDIVDIVVINSDDSSIISTSKGIWRNKKVTNLPVHYQDVLQKTLDSRTPQSVFSPDQMTYTYATLVSLSTLSVASLNLTNGAILVQLDVKQKAHALLMNLYTSAGIMLTSWSLLLVLVYLLMKREVLSPIQLIVRKVNSYQGVGGEFLPKKTASTEVELLSKTIQTTLDEQRAHLEALNQQKEIARASEERFRMITTHSGDIIFRCNNDGVIDYISPACESILARPPESLIGTSLFTLIYSDDRLMFESQLSAMLQTGKYGVITCRAQRAYGTPSWIETSIHPLNTQSDGAPFQLIGVARDVTERKRTEVMKNEFISMVSHELRTPLTSITGALGLVLGGIVGELSDKAKEMLNLAMRNADSLRRLIDDILDMEKLVAGKMVLDMQPHYVTSVVKDALDINRTYGTHRNVRLDLITECDAEAICVDELRFKQILSNLLSNAIKYSPDNETVVARVTNHEGRIRIDIRDNGPGVPEGFKAQMFERFSQADSSDSRKKGGTGLGLAICRELTIRMHGRIDFTSEPGSGACFFVEFPVAAGDSEITV